MLIDILFIILVIAAIIKGYSRGIIVAIFSVVALVIGLAAAIKLSVIVAYRLKDALHIAAKWLPVLAFILVFVVVVLLVRLGAKALEKTAEIAFLGWLNRLAGVILYTVLYIIIFSVLLFYAVKISLIGTDALASSRTYDFIAPWGPKAIGFIGRLVPFFKDMFQQLEAFFAGLSDKI